MWVSMTIVLMVLMVSWTGGSPVGTFTSEPKRFSYKVVDVPADSSSMQTLLNEYGQTGRELVSVGMGDMTTPRLVFKR